MNRGSRILPGLDGDAARPARRWLRISLGCLIVFVCAGIAGAMVANDQIETLRSAIGQSKPLAIRRGELAPAGWGDAQTVLLVGNDQRAHTTTTPVLPHSNEMLLVRIDPNRPWISMMSIPRELLVPIDTPSGVVTTRFNYALTAGGIPLLVSTIHQILGLSVNHVIVIDFNQFKRAIDDLGCIYSTVDRRYFHVNTATSEQYQEVDLEPGYQRLCGAQALQFVSYRHGDTSLVRDARDQSFLLDARKELSPDLLGNLAHFERIIGKTVQTDPGLHSDTGLLNLLGTAISSAGKPVRQVRFQVNLQPTFDTATPQQVTASVHSFLDGAVHVPRHGAAAVAAAAHGRGARARLALDQTPATELDQARTVAARLPFPLEFPRSVAALGAAGAVDLRGCPSDALQVTCLRRYVIHAPSGIAYPAYVVVQYAGTLGQFYDIQGTTWTGAPQLASPGQTVRAFGRTYALYYDGAHLNLVSWREDHAVYWVRNTLTDSLTNTEMLALSEQTAPLPGAHVSTPIRLPRVHLRGPDLAPVHAVTTSLTEEVGGSAGVVALAALLPLGLLLIRRRRQMRRLANDLTVLGASTEWLAAEARHEAVVRRHIP